MDGGDDIRDDFSVIAGDREFLPQFGEVPKSKGVPRSLVLAVSVGVVMIFLIGAGVILTSHYGHMWPWSSTLKAQLK